MSANHVFVRSHLEAGLRAYRGGDFEHAAKAFHEALAIAPAHPDASNLLGITLLELRRPGEAVEHLERAAQLFRTNAQVLGNLAQAYLAVRQHKDAESVFRRASRLEPAQPQYHVGVAAALASQGKVAEAATLLERLSNRFPHSALVWLNFGHTLRDQGQLDQALACYQKALEVDPMNAEAHNDIGRIFHTKLRFAAAEDAFRRCIELAPDHVSGRFNLTSLLIDVGRFGDAESEGRNLLTRSPRMAQAHSLLAAALAQQGRMLEAREAFLAAAELETDESKSLHIRAMALLESGGGDEGLRTFAKLIARGGESITARQALSTWLLGVGQLQDGWFDYLLRPAALRFREKYADLGLTHWLAGDVRAKHICVLREQGLGDELFFLRYAAVLAARGARVTYAAGAKIANMLGRLSWVERVVAAQDDAFPPGDAYMLLGDLPHALGAHDANELKLGRGLAVPALSDFPRLIRLYWPAVPPSIVVEPLEACLLEMRAKLSALGPGPYVGVTWRAGTKPEQQGKDWLLHKSIRLAPLADSLRTAAGTLIALQFNPGPGEVAELSAMLGRPLHDFTALNNELESMLALLSLLDDYVGVSNTNMHLRAAVGKTARVLVPAPAEWRWMQFGTRSPWFPGFKIYRQTLNGDWRKALQALSQDLGRAAES